MQKTTRFTIIRPLFFLLLSFSTKAQCPDDRTWQLHRNFQNVNVTQCSELLIDSTFNLSFDSLILNPNRYKFVPLHDGTLKNSQNTACWLRFKVKNTDLVPILCFIVTYQRTIERLQLFTVDEKGHVDTSEIIGSAFPYGKQRIPTISPSFTINFEAQKTYTFYLNIEQRDLPINTPVSLNSINTVFDLRDISWNGFLIGLGFCYVCIAFGMFLFMKKPLYFAFFVYTFGGVGYLVSTKCFGYVHLWSNLLIFEGISDNFFGCLSLIGFLMLTIYFFDTPQYFPSIDTLLKVVIFIGLFILITALFRKILPDGTFMLASMVGLLGIILALPAILWVAVRSYYLFPRNEALYFIVGFSVFLASAVTNLLTEIGYTSLEYWAHSFLPNLNLFFEFSILLFILGRRIKEEWVKQRLKELQLEKTISEQRHRISRDLHDDVGSTLNSIAVFSEIAMQQVKQFNPQVVPAITRISEASRHLIDVINDIVWAVNPKNDDFDNITLRMRLFAADLLMPKNVLIHFQEDACLKNVNLPVEKRKHFYLIFKEAINNVYKYAECSVLNIQIDLCGADICLTIADDGKGFKTINSQNGNGLISMQERAKILRGSLEVDSEINGGTTVKLCFPIDDKEPNKLPESVGQEMDNAPNFAFQMPEKAKFWFLKLFPKLAYLF